MVDLHLLPCDSCNFPCKDFYLKYNRCPRFAETAKKFLAGNTSINITDGVKALIMTCGNPQDAATLAEKVLGIEVDK